MSLSLWSSEYSVWSVALLHCTVIRMQVIGQFTVLFRINSTIPGNAYTAKTLGLYTSTTFLQVVSVASVSPRNATKECYQIGFLEVH